MKAYETVYKGGMGEIVEKKSRFIAQVFPVKTEEEAAEFIGQVKKEYWDARHNCYAFVLGQGGEITRCSDDGEPSGTAGRPILEVLMGRELTNILVIVTRYFGGTLLGTGGLVRAYSEAAKEGLNNSRLMKKLVGRRLDVYTDYNGLGKLQYVAANLSLAILDTVYTEGVELKLLVPEELREKAEKEITEATAGKAKLIFSKEEVYFGEIDKQVIVFEDEIEK